MKTLFKLLKNLWPLEFIKENWRVTYVYKSFGARMPKNIGYYLIQATSEHDAIQQAIKLDNNSPLINKQYPGKFTLTAHWLDPIKRIKWKKRKQSTAAVRGQKTS